MAAKHPTCTSGPRSYPQVGIQTPTVYLPGPGVDLKRWAVIACDQFTSQPDYWEQVEALVGDDPSTLRLTLPEIYLGKPGGAERISQAQAKMVEYLRQGVLEPLEGMVYIERQVQQGKCRRGLVLCLDLERYDYRAGSQSLIRATEGTILERLPPRMKIRRGAALELPHILVLIDDPERSVIEPLADNKNNPRRLQPLYDFELMLGSGHLSGYSLKDPALEAQVIAALEKLAEPQVFAHKYGIEATNEVLLFAMGDGNHSLATAKAVWEELKPRVGTDHPARYALVEIENVHDDGLQFEPIHRVLFELKSDPFAALRDFFGESVSFTPVEDCQQVRERIERREGRQSAGMAFEQRFWVAEFSKPSSNLAVGTLQPFVDEMLKNDQVKSVDYVHGEDTVCKLAGEAGNLGLLLPSMEKSELFKTVILDGALPRKTFSMGEAREKRFYMECRKIS
jgi:uncharacterized protein (DUF1015 family)